ncbi:MAG: ribonuclease Y [Candidatus Marinimicrobia bacterium]|nr:ribonuclease Y [Candidatus Neomarinimicrobiota bacterium]
MSNVLVIIVTGLLCALVGGGASLLIYVQKLKRAKLTAADVIENAQKESNNIRREIKLEAKDEAIKIRDRAENEAREILKEVRNMEKKLEKRELYLDRKMEVADKRAEELELKEKKLNDYNGELEEKKVEIEVIKEQQLEKLEKIAGLSSEEAQDRLKEELLEDTRMKVAEAARDIKEKAMREANKEAQKIIVSAIQRSAADHTAESTVSVVNLPSDNMKGRIIGREGRNIRHFESLTGIELIVDDTPEAVVLSGFDPVRREIARVTLEGLIKDGRIHPSRIEAMFEKAKKEVEESIMRAAEEAIDEVSLPPLNKNMMKILGKLKYRQSYGQNVLKHSIEVAWLAGLMASELGLDGTLAKRAGLLHDIGKAIDRNVTGTHASLGADIARRFKEKDIIINAIASHHEEVEMESPIAVLVQAADQISGSRQGARGDTLENYIQRLEKLEGIAESFEGVSKSYAIQAGREVRVLVENDKIDDAGADVIADQVAQKIQQDLTFPGQIKVVVLREHRSVSYAK